MTRNRLEDLGRISVMIENILNLPIFQEEWFVMKSKEQVEKEILITSLVYEIKEVEESLQKVLGVAEGIEYNRRDSD